MVSSLLNLSCCNFISLRWKCSIQNYDFKYSQFLFLPRNEKPGVRTMWDNR